MDDSVHCTHVVRGKELQQAGAERALARGLVGVDCEDAPSDDCCGDEEEARDRRYGSDS